MPRSWAMNPGQTYRAYVPVLYLTPAPVVVTHLLPPRGIAMVRAELEAKREEYIKRLFAPKSIL
jgi:hypothetical protein